MILQDIKLIPDTLHIWRVILELPTKFVVQIYADLLEVSLNVLEIIYQRGLEVVCAASLSYKFRYT